MYVIKDKRNRVLLEDWSWNHVCCCEKPYMMFPKRESAEMTLEECGNEVEHPPAEIANLQTLLYEIESVTRKRHKSEQRSLRRASVFPLHEPRVLHQISESEFEMVFSVFRVTHLVLSERRNVIGVVGETNDPQLPFYSYVGDDYHFVFFEEKCYSPDANPEETTGTSNWQEDGF